MTFWVHVHEYSEFYIRIRRILFSEVLKLVIKRCVRLKREKDFAYLNAIFIYLKLA